MNRILRPDKTLAHAGSPRTPLILYIIPVMLWPLNLTLAPWSWALEYPSPRHGPRHGVLKLFRGLEAGLLTGAFRRLQDDHRPVQSPGYLCTFTPHETPKSHRYGHPTNLQFHEA